MLVKTRREATTDALTGLGNRRQLTADLAAHLRDLDPERPLMLTLFDLDGFKHYNDTFGHLAGDQLLERLGARLSDLLTGRGTRVPDGRRRVLRAVDPSEGDETPVTTIEAVAALSEHGEAFSIGCSVRLGAASERGDRPRPTRCGFADRRMYIRKRSGRASAGQQSPTSCSGRWPNATRSSPFTWAASLTWRARPPCSSAFPRKTWKRRGRRRCSTTWARSRSQTRF